MRKLAKNSRMCRERSKRLALLRPEVQSLVCRNVLLVKNHFLTHSACMNCNCSDDYTFMNIICGNEAAGIQYFYG